MIILNIINEHNFFSNCKAIIFFLSKYTHTHTRARANTHDDFYLIDFLFKIHLFLCYIVIFVKCIGYCDYYWCEKSIVIKYVSRVNDGIVSSNVFSSHLIPCSVSMGLLNQTIFYIDKLIKQ